MIIIIKERVVVLAVYICINAFYNVIYFFLYTLFCGLNPSDWFISCHVVAFIFTTDTSITVHVIFPTPATNLPTKDLRSRRRSSPCIFQVVASLSTEV